MDALSRLVEALRCLPGVGPKSAQRMVFHLLQRQRQRGLHLAACLEDAMQNVRNCERCNNYTMDVFCSICQNNERDKTTLCVVESPADVAAIEQSHAFNGSYYVLMNKISPLDGIGPEEIGLSKLQSLIEHENIKEVILALSPTIEGQTTIHFIHELLNSHPVNISQLAHGIPSGGELEFLDGNTIGSALRNRAKLMI
ncbi:recombination mediator RecR [Legionella oakridgensis]|uniref:Recombination protein RecR n=2 Tax=Legionella oakridgensis TaxID=29423 RepID=W0B691_9GAMM|nr:recombination mediator RecR [Legionella oakridgensis]AHE66048.1 recombination protein RecR [Legionella oakridgensis ATCC 33761 = DSM 21215]ETO94198.1 DNA replication and repair protein RecR [Legionella oakridgensis RV-2-2007]KTD43547.1 Recombination and repair protein recR [Legionella oakridgensis]STY15970.1 Recombination and repair protein recR [Legionella longbeachae]